MTRGKKTKQRSERTIWLEGEEAILRKHKDTWINLDSRQERDAFAAGIVTEEIRNLTPHLYGVVVVGSQKKAKDEWDKKCKAIKNWFNNHRGPSTLRRVFKFERKIPLRNVIGHCRRAEVDARAEALNPDMKKGSNIALAQYQKALTSIINEMSDDDKKPYEEIREKWQRQGPPEEIKRKSARKYAKRIIMNMHEVASKHMGMLSVTIESHTREDGTIGFTFHDYNHEFGSANMKIKSFVSSNPRICREFGMVFADWVEDVHKILNGQASEVNGGANPPISILKGPGGLPIIPPPIIGKSRIELQTTQRDLLRSFFKEHYRLATGNPNAHPPWEAMGESAKEMFDAAYVPEGFIFKDPTRMKNMVSPLIAMLRERQAIDGEIAFQFRNVIVDGKFTPATYPREAMLAMSDAVDLIQKPAQEEPLEDPIPVGESITVRDTITLTAQELQVRQQQMGIIEPDMRSVEQHANGVNEPTKQAPASIVGATAILPQQVPSLNPATVLPSVTGSSSGIPPSGQSGVVSANTQSGVMASMSSHQQGAVIMSGAGHSVAWPGMLPPPSMAPQQVYAMYNQNVLPGPPPRHTWMNQAPPSHAPHPPGMPQASLAPHPPGMPSPETGPPSFHQQHPQVSPNQPDAVPSNGWVTQTLPPHPPGMVLPQPGPPSFSHTAGQPLYYNGVPFNPTQVPGYYYSHYQHPQQYVGEPAPTAPTPQIVQGTSLTPTASPTKAARTRRATGAESPTKKAKTTSQQPDTPVEKRGRGRPRKIQ